MSFEDELRETMRAHDGEAPSAAELPDRPWSQSRYRSWLPIAAAAAVVAVASVVLVIAQSRSHSPQRPAATSGTSVDCPVQYNTVVNEPWVPVDPEGVDGKARMVPDETPTTVRVCAYLHDDHGALTAERAVHGDLAAVTQTLTWLPSGTNSFPCPTYLAATDSDNYLIGLSYADGRVWVAAPGNHCAGASNGEFRTTANLSALADAAYTSGVWDPEAGQPAHPDPCTMTDSGRLGQDRTFVPDTPTGLAICAGANGQDEVGTDFDPAPFVAALNQLPTTADTGAYGCAQATGGTPTSYGLKFSYPAGPDVFVRVLDGCTPAVANHSLASDDDSTIMALLRGAGVAH